MHTINELAEYESIGVRADVYTNEFSSADYTEMHGALSEYKRKYEEDMVKNNTEIDVKVRCIEAGKTQVQMAEEIIC